MPPDRRRDAEHTRQRFHVDMSTWRGNGDAVPCLTTLQDGVWQDRKLRITFEKGDGTLSERVVDPLGLVAKGNLWYLVAQDGGQVKSFRASRVRSGPALNEVADRPEGFDLAAHWAQSKSDFVAALPRYRALVRVNPAIIRRMRFSDCYARVERVDPPVESGWQPSGSTRRRRPAGTPSASGPTWRCWSRRRFGSG